jgi:uncharacterized protein YyaL (SSP411 family)
VAIGTLEYILRELTTDDGAFAASQDADTDGIEGLTFTWRAAEVREVLGDDAGLFEAAYGVTDEGNWEGVTILSRVATDAELAGRFEMAEPDVAARLADARSRLLVRRAARPQPARDDKALAAWNGLAIAALADAAVAFAPSDAASAARYRDAAAPRGRDDRGRPDLPRTAARSVVEGRRASGTGILEDHADLADGLLALYVATFDERWFTTARTPDGSGARAFRRPSRRVVRYGRRPRAARARPKDVQDNAVPSGNAMAAGVLLRLAAWTGEGRYRSAAERAVRTVVPFVARYPTGFAQWLAAIDLALAPVAEVAIVGRRDDPATACARRRGDGTLSTQPGDAAAADDAAAAASAIALLHDRLAVDGQPTAYVCRAFACRLPVADPASLADQLADISVVA